MNTEPRRVLHEVIRDPENHRIIGIVKPAETAGDTAVVIELAREAGRRDGLRDGVEEAKRYGEQAAKQGYQTGWADGHEAGSRRAFAEGAQAAIEAFRPVLDDLLAEATARGHQEGRAETLSELAASEIKRMINGRQLAWR